MDWLIEERTLEQLENLAFPGLLAVVVIVVGLGQVDGVELQSQIFVGGLRARSGGSRQQPGGSDDTEPLRWVGDLRSALGHLE